MKVNLKDLTLREKIGQTAVAFVNNDMNKLDENPYGGMWSIGAIRFTTINMDDIGTNKNIYSETIRNKVTEYNKKLKVPIIPAMDNGNGIKHAFGELDLLEDSVAIGATDSEELAYEAGVVRARQLKSVASNWLWWPEIDLVNRKSVINWGRLFSDDPQKVSKLAIAAMKGCQDNGVAATAKHFPGSDSIEYRDPHASVSLLNISLEEWEEKQGKIFQDLIDAGIYSVMTGHQAFPGCDDTKIKGQYIPVSISHKAITELLKGKMGFKGVVVTDGIEMKGLMDMFDCDRAEVYIAAFNAGNDMLLGVKDDYIDIIEKAYEEGRVSAERIDDACSRVLEMKEKLGMFDEGYICASDDIDEVNRYTSYSNNRIAEKCISLVKNENKLLPVDKRKIKKVTAVVLSYDEEQIDSLKIMKEEFKKRKAEFFVKRNLYNYDEIKDIAENSDLVIYIGYLMRGLNNSFREDEKESFNYIMYHGAEKSLGVGMGVPFMYFDHFFGFHTFINCYNYYEETQRALVAAIYGEIPFEGGEPFKLIPEEFKYLK